MKAITELTNEEYEKYHATYTALREATSDMKSNEMFEGFQKQWCYAHYKCVKGE